MRTRHLHFKFLSIKNDKFQQHSGEKTYTSVITPTRDNKISSIIYRGKINENNSTYWTSSLRVWAYDGLSANIF
ncbi:hypothetical protein CGK17_18400 [Vibrio parahaemolyticus]|nr:hypothetical protein CGK17_18400 [Vibrio parahaemolyticus]TOF99340.1 hypothetical protein CGJ10_15725 [Vibrio parahaemolyticus]